MLGEYRRAAALAPAMQRREVAAAQSAYDETPNDRTRLALALALLLPQAPSRDDNRVQALLGAVDGAEGSSPRYLLAQTLLVIVAERQRRQDQLAHQLREARRHNEELQQKIESLLAIERGLRSRRRPE